MLDINLKSIVTGTRDRPSSAYSALPSDENLQSKQPTSPVVIAHSHRRYILYGVGVILTGAAAVLLVFIFTFKSEPTQRIAHCGSSASDARRLGCRFDIMSFSWLPPNCFDEELSHDFDTIQPWQWFADAAGTQEIPKSEVLMGEAKSLFVSFQYHRTHCVFMWRKLHRALGAKGMVDSYIGGYNHTVHCIPKV
ncbi:hypothetical protein J7T55_014798 [Diaporthe amygdali]|uniref:uncharacterized protein n=1 Tax=Phomopsis amygdali TaxID=1214568 RepID=UPI0022FF083A|nr:uncharacterized protein J7T55_014798 [Diaporthe amygdali]KAJ0109996.1 hypothetical protein J7T55_014798 [Diaporthe amygdali]